MTEKISRLTMSRATDQFCPLSRTTIFTCYRYSASSTNGTVRLGTHTVRPLNSDAQAIIFQQQLYLVGIRYQSYIPLARSAFQ